MEFLDLAALLEIKVYKARLDHRVPLALLEVPEQMDFLDCLEHLDLADFLVLWEQRVYQEARVKPDLTDHLDQTVFRVPWVLLEQVDSKVQMAP